MDVVKKLEELGSAFEEFKKANDKSLAEIKSKGEASGETTEKVTKLNERMDVLQKEIGQTAALLNRMDKTDDSTAQEKKVALAHKKACSLFLRKGDKSGAQVEELKDMSVDSDQDGGFLVSPEMSGEIVEHIFESTPMRALASVATISTDALEIMEDLDQVGSGWVAERGSRAVTTTPKLNMLRIPTHELYCEPQATQKLLDDAAFNVESWLAKKAGDKFGRDEATAFISGNGNSQPMGILTYGGTSEDIADHFGTIEQVVQGATGHSGYISFDDIFDMQTALKEPYQRNAVWLLHRSNLGGIRKLKDSYGRYLWEPGLQVGAPALLLGKPLYMAADLVAAASLTTNTVGGLVYGDMKESYQIVDRIGIRTLRDPYTAKPFVLFYMTKRVGGGVKNFESIKILKQAAS